MSNPRSLVPFSFALLSIAACGGDDITSKPDAGDDFTPWTLEALEPSEGFTVMTPTFEVPAGTEVQDCYFFQVPDVADGGDIWIDRTLTAINPGSHHMNVFRVKTIMDLDPAKGEPVDMGGIPGTAIRSYDLDSPCWDSAQWADWPLVANSQKSNPDDPYTDWVLPDGVASRFSPGEMLMIQVHYVNASTQETPYKGRVGINFYRTTDEAPMELGTLFATQQSIRICASNPEVKYAGTCSVPEGTSVEVTAANGHFHSRGTRFRIFSWDGVSIEEPPMDDMFYESESWDDPPMETELGVPLANGGGVWWTCEYSWNPPEVGCDAVNERDPQQEDDCCYTFGGLVDYNEHCNVFLYYWPKIDDTDIFCN